MNEKISEKIATQHLEQLGRVRGTLTLGTQEYTLNGIAEYLIRAS
jgi:hypothetical protein